MRELSHRVEELEEALHGILSTNTPVGISPWSTEPLPEASNQIPHYSTSPVTATGQQAARNLLALRDSSTLVQTPSQSKPVYHLSRCQLGNNWYFKGVGILSPRGRQWISEGAGQRDFLENFDIFGANPVGTTPQLPSPALPKPPKPLPPQALCKYLFESFSKSKISRIFPILNRDLFEVTIARAYNGQASDAEHCLSAEACLWAMLALAVRTEGGRHVESIPEANDCVQEVRRLLIVLNGAANLDSLQATLLLVRRLP